MWGLQWTLGNRFMLRRLDIKHSSYHSIILSRQYRLTHRRGGEKEEEEERNTDRVR